MERILDQHYDRATLINTTSILFERAAYYGFRAIIVLFLMEETINMTLTETIEIYSWFMIVNFFTSIIGALLGDFVLGNRVSMLIGGLLQAAGAFAFCFPAVSSVYIGLALFTIGGGLYSPNLIAYFGKSYLHRMKLLDSAYTIYHFTSNLGAFFGVLLTGYLGEKFGWTFGFLAAGVLILMSTCIVIFTKPKEETSEIIQDKPQRGTVRLILLGLLFVGMYSAVIFLLQMNTYTNTHGLSEVSNPVVSFLFNTPETPIISLIFYLVFVFLWSRYYTPQLAKLLLALTLTIPVIGILMVFSPFEGNLLPIAIALVFISLCEVLTAPFLYSFITKHVKRKYLTTALSLSFLPVSLSLFIVNFSTHDYFVAPIKSLIVAIVVAVAAVIGLLFLIKWQHNKARR